MNNNIQGYSNFHQIESYNDDANNNYYNWFTPQISPEAEYFVDNMSTTKMSHKADKQPVKPKGETSRQKRGPHLFTRPSLRNLNPVFHKREESEDSQELSVIMLKQARKSGVLKLAGKGLTSVPAKVYNINESDKDVEVTLEELVVKEEDAWWNQMPLTNLDLSSNALTHLSPKIENLYTLTTLTLHDNILTALPKEIGKLEKLTHVNLSRNKLRELPVEFFTLPDLRVLNLSHNEFEELNPDVSDLHMLEKLDASHNNLLSIPCGIGFLVRVTDLVLAHNHIKELPADLVNMRSLQRVDLNHNDLKALPADIGSLRKLQCLYLQHNDIKELPYFNGCADLQELYAANNFLEKLPKKFCLKLPHLKILDLRDNKIVQLPDEIVLLKDLVRLDLTNNSLKNLPTTLSSLAHLSCLQLEGNPIKSIRRDILQCGTTRILKTLRDRSVATDNTAAAASTSASASLSSTHIKSPTLSRSSSSSSSGMGADGLNSPRRVSSGPAGGEDGAFPDKYKMRNTHCLNLTMQNLNDIPENVFVVAAEESVNCVDVSKNRLDTLPNGLRHLHECVSELVFANNLISKVPPFVSQFTRISLINLACNILTDLPKEFGLLNTLRELNISNNRFENIPRSIYDLQSLEILLANDNRIKCIDASLQGLGALKRLATLDLRNNNIESVPPILGNLENINKLELLGNPFRQPRHQIIQKGTDAIMSYLRDRIPV